MLSCLIPWSVNEDNCSACFMEGGPHTAQDRSYPLGCNVFTLEGIATQHKLRRVDSVFLLAPAIGAPQEELMSLLPNYTLRTGHSILLKRDLNTAFLRKMGWPIV